jgi:glyoxylase-like metal-dependent hydrolase (beta-lactamase superfamily II)
LQKSLAARGGLPAWYGPLMITRYPHGITCVDAEYVRPGSAAVHVIERDGRVGIVDTGANSSVPLVLRALQELGSKPELVDWLFLTHVHLDHAGGAGALLEHLPGAKALVHPRGASHLMDPTRLEQATISVYGQRRFERLYGRLVPVAPERLHETSEGERVQLGKSELSILHTPGHALHHQVLFDPAAAAAFTGDTFGLAYPELATSAGSFVVPTTTPTQFDPEQLLSSIRRIAALEPERLYLTHFGPVSGVAQLAASLQEQVVQLAELAQSHAGAADRQARIRSALRDNWVERAQRHGVGEAASQIDAVLGGDIELNTQGLLAWLERSQKAH